MDIPYPINQLFNKSGILTQGRFRANIAAGQTDSSVVAAVTGFKIMVTSYTEQAGGTATNITWNSASTAISSLHANAINGGRVCPFNPQGWFETNSGEALTVTTGAGSTTGIDGTYVLVPA